MEANKLLYPPDIRFSQNSITNHFSEALGKEYIGVVVDKIYNGDANLQNRILDNMQIGRWEKSGFEGMWFTVNNRSLWVLKELQKIGKLNKRISVKFDPHDIGGKRFTTKNEGTCVVVRHKPVGGNKAVPAYFWKYKQDSALESRSYLQVGSAQLGYYDDDDGYDSDEYYH